MDSQNPSGCFLDVSSPLFRLQFMFVSSGLHAYLLKICFSYMPEQVNGFASVPDGLVAAMSEILCLEYADTH
jgi:hypothetical protein